jgi:hypothetical protein
MEPGLSSEMPVHMFGWFDVNRSAIHQPVRPEDDAIILRLSAAHQGVRVRGRK